MDEKSRVHYAELVLKQYKLGIMQHIDLEFAQEPEIEAGIDRTARSLMISMRQRVMGQEIEDVRIEYAADWWEAFKERWFPAFLLRRYPVIKKYHHFTAAILYPQIALPGDKYQRFYLWDHQQWKSEP